MLTVLPTLKLLTYNVKMVTDLSKQEKKTIFVNSVKTLLVVVTLVDYMLIIVIILLASPLHV